MSSSNKTATSSAAVLATLVWIRQQGFKPVPLHPRSKAPVREGKSDEEDYASPKYVAPPDEFWTQRNCNIGVVTGTAPNPTDIDLDCKEAIALAPFFFPATGAVFGRKSKPKSHYIYLTADDIETCRFLDPTNYSMLLECRAANTAGGGHQTVFPGSLHEGTGELIEWACKPAVPMVTTVSPNEIAEGRRSTAIGCVVVRHMWQEGQRNQVCLHLAGMFWYAEWPVERAEHFIDAIMKVTGDTDRTRIATVRSTYNKADKGKPVAGAPALRKFIDPRIVDCIQTWLGHPGAAVLQDYNARYAAVMIEGQFRIARTDVAPGVPLILMKPEDFNHSTQHEYLTIDNKQIPKSRMWLKNPYHRSYDGVEYWPGDDDAPGNRLNLWTGWAVPPARTARGCEAWLELALNVICNGDQQRFNWLMAWLASIIRTPRSKSRTSPVIIGLPGAGKTLFVAYFGRILGAGYVPVSNAEHIHGKHNAHQGMMVLLHSEEAVWGGERQHKAQIKSIITDDTLRIEPKNINSYSIRNYIRLIFTSNELRAAPVEYNDRRYTIFQLLDKASDELIKRVVAELEGDGPAALHRYLLSLRYDPELPTRNLRDASLLTAKMHNLQPEQAWWYETLRNGRLLPDLLNWAQYPIGEPWPTIVSGPALYTTYLMVLRRGNWRTPLIPVVLNDRLDEMVYPRPMSDRLERGQVTFQPNMYADDLGTPPEIRAVEGGRRYAIKNLPSLAECRANFKHFLGQPVEWPSMESSPDDEQRYRDAMKGRPPPDKPEY